MKTYLHDHFNSLTGANLFRLICAGLLLLLSGFEVHAEFSTTPIFMWRNSSPVPSSSYPNLVNRSTDPMVVCQSDAVYYSDPAGGNISCGGPGCHAVSTSPRTDVVGAEKTQRSCYVQSTAANAVTVWWSILANIAYCNPKLANTDTGWIYAPIDYQCPCPPNSHNETDDTGASVCVCNQGYADDPAGTNSCLPLNVGPVPGPTCPAP